MDLAQWGNQEKLKEDIKKIVASDAFKEAEVLIKDVMLSKAFAVSSKWDNDTMNKRQHSFSLLEGSAAVFDLFKQLPYIETKKTAKTDETPFEYMTPEEQERLNKIAPPESK